MGKKKASQKVLSLDAQVRAIRASVEKQELDIEKSRAQLQMFKTQSKLNEAQAKEASTPFWRRDPWTLLSVILSIISPQLAIGLSQPRHQEHPSRIEKPQRPNPWRPEADPGLMLFFQLVYTRFASLSEPTQQKLQEVIDHSVTLSSKGVPEEQVRIDFVARLGSLLLTSSEDDAANIQSILDSFKCPMPGSPSNESVSDDWGKSRWVIPDSPFDQ